MKALNKSQRETRKSAIGLFLNLGCAAIVVTTSGMDSFSDWLLLTWCVVCIIGCIYYIQADIKAAMKGEGEDAT